MLALGFLLMIGMTLIADGFGFHVPKGYIYAAMAFSALVEGLNMLGRGGAGPGAEPASDAEPGPTARALTNTASHTRLAPQNQGMESRCN